MTVLVFVTSWCPDCGRARRTLQRHGIAFEEIDIETSPGSEETMRSLNGNSGKVPTVVIDTPAGRTVLVEPSSRELTDVLCARGEG